MDHTIRCRLCFSDNICDDTIFNMKDELGVTLSSKIMLCTSLMVQPDDEFSKFVCTQCNDLLELFFVFRNTCFKTHVTMHSAIQQSSEPDPVVVEFQSSSDPENSKIKDKQNGALCVSIVGDTNQDKSDFMNGFLEYETEELESVNVDKMKKTKSILPVPQESLIMCATCSKTFSSCAQLSKHWQTCQELHGSTSTNLSSEMLSKESNDCNVLVNFTKALHSYSRPAETPVVSESSSRTYVCEHCSESFKSKRARACHIAAAHNVVRKFSCSKCPKTFKDMYELKYHQRLHEDVENFFCNICGKRFSRKSALKKHILIHTGEKPYKCRECGKSFTYIVSLTIHERTHSGEKPFACQYCGRTFAQKSTATTHEQNHLNGDRPFQCFVCDRMFRTQPELDVHKTSHEGSRGRVCPICQRGFGKASYLELHILRAHSKIRPYPCDQCSKAFASAKDLKNHTEIKHSGIDRFTCMFCNKGYTAKQNLRKHLARQHQNADITSISGSTSFQSTSALSQNLVSDPTSDSEIISSEPDLCVGYDDPVFKF